MLQRWNDTGIIPPSLYDDEGNIRRKSIHYFRKTYGREYTAILKTRKGTQ